ncbi:unnamed protein product [Phaedon cochleariae]|uniref:Glucose-methanol-choline oxidoreductase N-terminal domain-containing protein n=1 Tax=Phaedon cochleariae TaxID=80249 RepID=A0A9P0DK11_PHACE|nr:unnamed protein product [Phaedon cochleariae]
MPSAGSGPQNGVADPILASSYNQSEVDYIANLVKNAEKNGHTYQVHENTYEYKPTNISNIEDFGTFDFIVVGGGSGGSVIASRLTEIRNWTVLLIEAGGFGNDETDIPFLSTAIKFSRYNWGFFSTPQRTCCQGMIDQKCSIAQGRGIGGTSLIDDLVYSRGSSIDFDKWAKYVKDERWSYKQVLPYFKKSEKYTHRDRRSPVVNSMHGKKGLLSVSNFLPESPQLQAWLRANKELGYRIADYNAGTGLGSSPAQLCTKDGRRFDDGKAFIRPFINRHNLNVSINSYVTKILIDPMTKTAEGVIFSTLDKKQYRALASKEVILCAGAMNSPLLLMLSGIGPKNHLRSLRIPVIENLEVGSYLKDHPAFEGLIFDSNYTEPVKPVTEYVEEYLRGVGPYTIAASNQGVGFYESSRTKGTGYPDIEILMVPANATNPFSQRKSSFTEQTYADLWEGSNQIQAYRMVVIHLHAQSTGTLRLKSADPYDYPLIDLNLLSDWWWQRDIGTLYEGVQIALNLASTEALRGIGSQLRSGPLKACQNHEYLSKRYWYCALRQLTTNIHRPVSTCPMGPNTRRGDVVDAVGKVHGLKKLRVADASVFPFSLAGHPNAAVVLVAEVISDFIKMEYNGIK